MCIIFRRRFKYIAEIRTEHGKRNFRMFETLGKNKYRNETLDFAGKPRTAGTAGTAGIN